MKGFRDNKIVTFWKDNQKRIIESIVIAAVTSLFLTAIITRSFLSVFNIRQFIPSLSTGVLVASLLICGVFSLVLYYWHEIISKILMFAATLVYCILVALFSANQSFDSMTMNPVGQYSLLAVLGVLVVFVFLYIRDDIYKLIEYIRVNDLTLKVVTVAVGLAIFSLTLLIGLYKYWSYQSPTADFGIFAQLYEYLKSTGTPTTTVERAYELSHNAVHFSPILYVGLPLYFIIPRAETVVAIQAIMVALPVLPIYLLGKRFNISNKIIFGIMAIYALYPATISGTFYDFHENAFLTFSILMLIWAVERKKNIMIAIFALATFAVKEDAFIYVFILGLFWIASRKDNVRGFILMVCSGIYYFIADAIVKSYGIIGFADRFNNLFYKDPGTMPQIIKTVIANPGYAISQIVSNSKFPVQNEGFNNDNFGKIGFMIVIFVPIACLLFATGKKYSRYLLLIPLILICLLTTYQYQHEINFQYNFGHIAMFIYIIYLNISEMDKKKVKKYMISSVLICLVMFAGLIVPKFNNYRQAVNNNSEAIKIKDKACSMIPKDKSVYTTSFLMAHVSRNLDCYDITNYYDEKDKNKRPDHPDYLLIDEASAPEVKEKFNTYISSGNYKLIYEGKTGGEKTVSVYQFVR